MPVLAELRGISEDEFVGTAVELGEADWGLGMELWGEERAP